MVLKGAPGLSKDVRRRHMIEFKGQVDQTNVSLHGEMVSS
jgi:hypothetical protein